MWCERVINWTFPGSSPASSGINVLVNSKCAHSPPPPPPRPPGILRSFKKKIAPHSGEFARNESRTGGHLTTFSFFFWNCKTFPPVCPGKEGGGGKGGGGAMGALGIN